MILNLLCDRQNGFMVFRLVEIFHKYSRYSKGISRCGAGQEQHTEETPPTVSDDAGEGLNRPQTPPSASDEYNSLYQGIDVLVSVNDIQRVVMGFL